MAVVLDSCHSGGMTRGVGNVAVRGIESIDTAPRRVESLVAGRDELIQNWDRVTDGGTRKVSLGSGWMPEPKGYTLLAACRPTESALEFAFDGVERNGALTYWLLDCLSDAGPGLSYKVLHDRIVAKVRSQFEDQTPQLQGEGDRAFLGSDRVEPQYAVTVMEVDAANDRVLLAADQAQGLRNGAKFAIYPRGADLSKAELRQAAVEISKLGATDSLATISERWTDATIEQGAQAVLLGAGSVRLVQKVHLARGDGLPAEIDQEAALEAVKQALTGNGWVELAAEGELVDHNVAVNERGEYEIWDRAGQVIANLRPALKVGVPNAAAGVVGRLVHLAKYTAVKQLSNSDPTSPLARKLEVELVGRRAVYDPADPWEPEEIFAKPGHTPLLKAGEWTALRIKNKSTYNLNVSVVDLQPDGPWCRSSPARRGIILSRSSRTRSCCCRYKPGCRPAAARERTWRRCSPRYRPATSAGWSWRR